MPGYWIEPCERRRREDPVGARAAIISRHLPRSQNVKPQASSGVSVAGWSGGGARRERLRGRQRSRPRRAVLRHRALLDREERLAAAPVEQEQVAHLGGLGERRDRPAGPGELEERRLRGRVVVPEVVVHRLEVPARATGARVERDDRARVVVERRCAARRSSRATCCPWARRRGPSSGSAEIAVQALEVPRVAAGRRPGRAGRPGGTGSQPHSSAPAARVVGAHHSARARRRADRRAPCAPVTMRSPSDQRRRGHAVLAAASRRRCPARRSTVAAVAEVRAAAAPVGGVERDQARVERAHEDARAAGRALRRARVESRPRRRGSW